MKFIRRFGGRRAARGERTAKKTLEIDGEKISSVGTESGSGRLMPSVAASRSDVSTFFRREEGEKRERQPDERRDAGHNEENNAARVEAS